MARKSLVQRNLKRTRMATLYAEKRAALKVAARDKSASLEDRFAAQLKLAALPRNSALVRVRNRCEVTGRARGYYRTLRLSRIALRQLGSAGFLPGMVKSSW